MLKKKHGNLIRAWRQELAANDTMTQLDLKELIIYFIIYILLYMLFVLIIFF